MEVNAALATKAIASIDHGLAQSSLVAPLELAGLSAVVPGHIYEGTTNQVEHAMAAVDTSGPKPQHEYDADSHVHHLVANGRTLEIHEIGSRTGTAARALDEIKRVPQGNDDGHEYQYDQMHPGPLSDGAVYDPHNTGAQLPAHGFYGAKYDELVLAEDTVLYRVGNAEREWGEWFTDHPIESETQCRIDLAVKREWSDPRTNEMPPNSARSQKQLEPWSYTILIPKGTTVYTGQVGSQGGVFMGALGPGSKQYFVPKAWTLQAKGGKVIARAPFKRDGHTQPAADKSASKEERK